MAGERYKGKFNDEGNGGGKNERKSKGNGEWRISLFVPAAPVRAGWKLNPNDAKPEETTAGAYRFRVSVGAKGSTTLTVREASPLESSHDLSNVDADQVTVLVREKSINPANEQELRKIVAQKERVDELNGEVSRRGTKCTASSATSRGCAKT